MRNCGYVFPLAAFGTFLCVSLNSAQAQLHECDGKWTNKPCGGMVTGTLDDTTFSKTTSEDPNRGQKTSLLHELTMNCLRARDDVNMVIDISAAEETCLKKPSTVEECRSVIKGLDDELDKKKLTAGTVASQKRANDLQEEANKLQAERNEIEANKPDILVVEERRAYFPPIRRDDFPRDHIHNDLHDGHHHDVHDGSGGGASIQVNTTSASGNTAISVGASTLSGSSIQPVRRSTNSIEPIAPIRHADVMIRDNAGQRSIEPIGAGASSLRPGAYGTKRKD